jgi:hypothetical protein
MAYTTNTYARLTWHLLKQRYPLSHEYIQKTPWIHSLPLVLHLGLSKLFYFFDEQQLLVFIDGHPPNLTPGYFRFRITYHDLVKERLDWEEDKFLLFPTRAEAETAAFHAAFAIFEKQLSAAKKLAPLKK